MKELGVSDELSQEVVSLLVPLKDEIVEK